MNYSILEEEKRNISKLLNLDYLKKVNFVIDSLDNNISDGIANKPKRYGIIKEGDVVYLLGVSWPLILLAQSKRHFLF